MDMEMTYTGSLQMTLKTKMVLTKLGKQEMDEDAAKQRYLIRISQRFKTLSFELLRNMKEL